MNLTPEMIEAAAYKMAEMEGSGQRFLDDKAGKLSDIDGTYEGYLAEAAETLKAAFSAMLKPITLTYTNWRGETAERTIIPHSVWYGSTEWHPEPQWLLKATDTEKGAERDFALKDFGPTTPAPQPVAVKPGEIIKMVEECVLHSNVSEYAGLADHAAFEAGQDNAVQNISKMLRREIAALTTPPADLDRLREENERLKAHGTTLWTKWRNAVDRANDAEAHTKVLEEALKSVPKKPGVTCTSSDWDQDDEAQGWSDAFHTKHMRSCRSDAYSRGYGAGKTARAALKGGA